MAPVQFAIYRWRRTCHIDFFPCGGTVGRRKLLSFRINEDRLHSIRHRKVFDVAILRQRRGTGHEVRPDGSCHYATRYAQVAIVIEADPDHAEEVGSESSEPSVAGCAGLSGSRQGKAPRADSRSRAPVPDVFQQAVDKEGDPPIQRLLSLWPEPFDLRA